jgi:MFS family permease
MTYTVVDSSNTELSDDLSSVDGSLQSGDEDSVHTVEDQTQDQERYETLTNGEGEHHLDDGSVVEITDAVKIYTICASLSSCIVGYDQGVSTHMSMLIQAEFGLNEWQRGLYIAFLFLFMMWGAMVSPFISDRHGRRASLLSSSYACLAGALVMAFMKSYGGLLIGRALCGFGAGLGFLVDTMYIAEISPASHRGELVTWSYVAATLGLLLGISVGFIFGFLEGETRWRTMLVLGMVFPIASIAACTKVLVETPRFLVTVKRSKEARLVLDMIYPKNYNVNAVLEDIRVALQREKMAEEAAGHPTLRQPSLAYRRILYLAWGISFAQEAVGVDAIQYYIFDVMEVSEVDAKIRALALFGVIIIKLQCIVICSQLLDLFGRKLMLFFSMTGRFPNPL